MVVKLRGAVAGDMVALLMQHDEHGPSRHGLLFPGLERVKQGCLQTRIYIKAQRIEHCKDSTSSSQCALIAIYHAISAGRGTSLWEARPSLSAMVWKAARPCLDKVAGRTSLRVEHSQGSRLGSAPCLHIACTPGTWQVAAALLEPLQ